MELQKNPQHIVWLDVVRFVAMFTVVCCHCTDPFNFYSFFILFRVRSMLSRQQLLMSSGLS